MSKKNKQIWSPMIAKCLSVFAPPERLKTSEWAEKHRVLNAKASAMAGPWNNAVTPYLVGIMDAFDDPTVETITFCKPTQVGGTEVELNCLGKIIGVDPSPTLVVYPGEDLAKRVGANRIRPMIESSPQLRAKYHEDISSVTEYQFDDMFMSISWAGSAAGLASFPMRVVLLDEVDKYPSNAGKEADPISLAKERTKTYDNRKIYITSTPTLPNGPVWRSLQSADCIMHYFVPCPECGEMIELAFKQLNFSNDETLSRDDRAATAIFVCPECGALIPDTRKPAMLRAGQWRAVKGERKNALHVGFWMNTLYSPWVTWSQIATEWIKDHNDPELLQNFINSWLAEPWEDLRMKTDADMVLARQTDVPRWQAPDWAEMLTGGVDVQRDGRLYWVLRAWGKGLTSQNIAHGCAKSWDDITSVMSQSYRKSNGAELVVDMCGIDSGDQTDTVLEFCLAHPEWAVPIKGRPTTPATASGFSVSYQDSQGATSRGWLLTLVYGDKYKDIIARRMMLDMGEGCWMVHAGCDRDYAEQVTSEQRVADRSGRETWKPRTSHAANHYLDAEVYAFAVADRLGVRQLTNNGIAPSETANEAKNDTQSSTPNSWLGGSAQNWLGNGNWFGNSGGKWI